MTFAEIPVFYESDSRFWQINLRQSNNQEKLAILKDSHNNNIEDEISKPGKKKKPASQGKSLSNMDSYARQIT